MKSEASIHFAEWVFPKKKKKHPLMGNEPLSSESTVELSELSARYHTLVFMGM